ncbi:MAG: hypothetical protein ACU843_05980 [Gammaproteobacteria bacterium]
MSSGKFEISRKARAVIPREYIVSGLTFFFVPVCFYLDAGSDRIFQNTLGAGAWLCLFVLLTGEDKLVRLQVAVAIAFATLGEHFASIYMEGYIYRFHNVPAFVPPGHGLVYLTAVVLARSDLFCRYQGRVTVIVIGLALTWSTWGLFFAHRNDVVGFLLFLAFAVCLIHGPSPRVYLGAFFITSWLELVGTFLGTWSWVMIDPASGLPQGNPPSGVAAWYCLVDAVAIGGASLLAHRFERRRARVGVALVVERDHPNFPGSLGWCIEHAELPVIALILFL